MYKTTLVIIFTLFISILVETSSGLSQPLGLMFAGIGSFLLFVLFGRMIGFTS